MHQIFDGDASAAEDQYFSAIRTLSTETSPPEVYKVAGYIDQIPRGLDTNLSARVSLDYVEKILNEVDRWMLNSDGQFLLEQLHKLQDSLATAIITSKTTLCREDVPHGSLGASLDASASDFQFIAQTMPTCSLFIQRLICLMAGFVSDDPPNTCRKRRTNASASSYPKESFYIQVCCRDGQEEFIGKPEVIAYIYSTLT